MLCASLRAADWTLHGALGSNPWCGFHRVSPDRTHIEMRHFGYGIDPTWSFDWDGWIEGDNSGFWEYATGSVLTLSSDWGTTEILYDPIYGSSSSINWGIEDGPPYFNGWGSQEAPAIPGEYWIDWTFDGLIRISSSQPVDFGKWEWDGSVNPYWIPPLLPQPLPGKHLAKGHSK